jgi:hypothetical protein
MTVKNAVTVRHTLVAVATLLDAEAHQVQHVRHRLVHGGVADVEELPVVQGLSELGRRVRGDEASVRHPVICHVCHPRVGVRIIALQTITRTAGSI